MASLDKDQSKIAWPDLLNTFVIYAIIQKKRLSY